MEATQMLRVGATESERHQVIARLKAGKSYGDATEPLRGTVEAEWFERNEDELLMIAGKKTKRAATDEEKRAAAVLLRQKTPDGELRYPSVESLAPVFPAVDPKTLKFEK